jgi:hypothetical protein
VSLSALSLGFSSPAAFYLGIPILVVMVYAYLRKKKLQPVLVPSLFLLKDMTTVISKRRRFLPPRRFWIELLLLALLLICLAGFFHKRENVRYAAVLDNSLSTAAEARGATLLDLSKEQLLSNIKTLPGSALFDLYRTSPRLERVGGVGLSVTALSSVLDQIQSVYSADNFDKIISQVMQRDSYQGLLLFTDQKFTFVSETPEPQRFASAHSVLVENGAKIDNIALSNIVSSPAGDQIQVAVTSYAKAITSFSLILEGFDNTIGSWRAINSEKLSLKESETKDHNFALPEARYSGFRVRIDSESIEKGSNQLLLDDVAYLVEQAANSIVYVVSPRGIEELGISKVRGIDFKAINNERYQATLSKPEAATYLFVDYVPNGLPDKNSLVIAPPNGTSGFRTLGITAGAEITEWLQGHALLTYIDVASINLNKFSPIGLPNWGEAIISTSKGAALIAGERGENRYVVAGFDLFPYRGRASPMASVFFLNMLRWVSGASIGGSTKEVYQQISVPLNVNKVKILNDKQDEILINNRIDRSAYIPEVPGIYMPESPTGRVAASAVNYFTASESNLNATKKSVSVSPVISTPAALENQKDISDYLLPLLILIFIVDAIYSIYRTIRIPTVFKSFRFTNRGRA